MSSEQTFQLVNESMSLQLQFSALYENIAKESAIKAVLKCAEMYGFDGAEAIQRLGLISQKVNLSEPIMLAPMLAPMPAPKPVAKPLPKTKKSAVISKPAFPLPYNGELNEELCYGLVLNEALFTQCPSFPKDGVYCPKCAKQCATTDNGKPMYGTIQDRQKVGIMEYVDPKNRVPVEYVKVMNKYKVSRDDVIAEAGKHNMTIDPVHFEIADKKKGRPKNPTTRVVENTNEPDLFNDLISSKPIVEPSSASQVPVKATNAPAKATKAPAKATKADEKEKEKKQKEEEKQRKLDEKLKEKKQKEEEKQRKLDEKKQKDAPKKKATAPKNDDKKKDDKKKDAKKEEKNDEKNEQKEEEDDTMELPNTICFHYNGKEYHRSVETNNVYLVADDGIANIVGTYDEATKTIVYHDSKLYDDEESEESYDEDEEESLFGADDEDEDAYETVIDELDEF